MSIKTQQINVWYKKAGQELDKYWTSEIANLRSKWFVEQIGSLDFDSIFEVGVFSGRNLRYIQDRFPNAKVGGVDVSEQIVEYASEKVPEAKIECSTVYDMNTDDKWDIVFTMGVLLHIPMDQINTAVSNCVKRANKYVIHLETDGDNVVSHGPADVDPKIVKELLRWKPNLTSIYDGLGYNVDKIEVPREFSTSGAKHFLVVKI